MKRIRLTFIIFLITNLIIAEERIQSQLPVYNISRALGDITIDGLLDDQGWQGTNIINDFYEFIIFYFACCNGCRVCMQLVKSS